MATCGMVFKTKEDVENPNNVKIVTGLKKGDKKGRALYFTRAAAPYIRDPQKIENQDYCENCGNFLSDREIVGKCPKCGGDILVKKSKRGKKYYICENNDNTSDVLFQ